MHRQDDQWLVLEAILDLDQSFQLLTAFPVRRGPEMEDDYVAAIVHQLCRTIVTRGHLDLGAGLPIIDTLARVFT